MQGFKQNETYSVEEGNLQHPGSNHEDKEGEVVVVASETAASNTSYETRLKSETHSRKRHRCDPLCGWPWWPQIILLGVCVFVYFGQTLESVAIRYSYEYDATAVASIAGETIFEEPDKGVETNTWKYNIWQGIKDLWEQKAHLLAVFLAAWSGFWPYIKLFVVGLALFIYRKADVPESYEWLSTIGHYSFIDVWFVVITAVALRLEFTESTTKTQEDVVESVDISTTVELTVFILSFALTGAYLFIGAIILSQFVGFVLLRVGQWRTWISTGQSTTQPKANRNSCKVICLGFESCCCQVPQWVKYILTLSGFVVIIAVFLFVLYALHVNIYRTTLSFDVNIDISESQDFTITLPLFGDITVPFTYEETFEFEDTEKRKHSLYSSCHILKDDTDPGGEGSNKPMFYIAIILIYYLTLIRIALLGFSWIVPLPLVGHWIIFTANEVISLFTSMDSFAIAYVIMCPIGQLDTIFDHVAKSFGSNVSGDQGDVNYDINFDMDRFLPGGAVFVAAAIVDQINAFVFMGFYRRMLMPSLFIQPKSADGKKEGAMRIEQDSEIAVVVEQSTELID